MSKKSQQEARQKQEEIEQQKHLKFLDTLNGYLKMFAELLPRNKELGPLSEIGAAGYEIALKDLTPSELKIGCDEALKVCTFFPGPAEIRECLHKRRERTNAFGHSPSEPSESSRPMSKEDRDAIGEKIMEAGRRLTMPGKKSRDPGEEG